jgi:hypothetical protein
MAEVTAQATITEKTEKATVSLICENNANPIDVYLAWQKIGDWLIQKIQEMHKAREPQKAPEQKPEQSNETKIESIG